ncbi:site-specific integrase [Sorangium sp. So ce887]|uniref:site-specific integrase n=1 Tax=Sorangium sp. So ce887 TaxID=3133324 RepID=UPI003F61B8FB
MSEDMRLRDFRPRTQEGFLLAVRQFIDRVAREPEALTDEDVRAYFLYLREERKLALSSINIAVHALRFFLSTPCSATGRCSTCFGSTSRACCRSS